MNTKESPFPKITEKAAIAAKLAVLICTASSMIAGLGYLDQKEDQRLKVIAHEDAICLDAFKFMPSSDLTLFCELREFNKAAQAEWRAVQPNDL
jgi:hypothetical protein